VPVFRGAKREKLATQEFQPVPKASTCRTTHCARSAAAGFYTDQGISGAAVTRPQLERAMKALKPGDELVVWKLDRLGRSLIHLVSTIQALHARGIGFRSLTEAIDISNSHGKLLLGVMSALAESERDLIGERTRAGRAAAVKRGVRFGRLSSITPKRAAHARKLRAAGEAVPDIAALLSVSRYTVYRALRTAG
jgi:DNA invertase Pin-like site-specific DNA recombinase